MSLASLTSMTLETKVQEHSFNQAIGGARFGIHYFTNTSHYHQADLKTWLPQLRKLGVSWVVLPSPADRAIPEEFITTLVNAEIKPILHFQLGLDKPTNFEELAPLFKAYASWGVNYAAFFDRPNLRSQWPATGWTQRGLVDRFLDIFVPVAKAAIEAGLTPIFPALEPGGDYWDTAFLRSALEALQTRGGEELLSKLAIGANAWTSDKPIVWGAGGPERWPATLPYFTPDNSQDQRGFHVFDWYNAVMNAAIGHTLPIIILAAGVKREAHKLDAQDATRAIKMAEALQLDPKKGSLDSVPANVLACNFWVLAASADDPEAGAAWFQTNGKPARIAKEWIAWRSGERPKDVEEFEIEGASESFDANETIGDLEVVETHEPIEETIAPFTEMDFAAENDRLIHHYLLLPSNGNLPLESITPFVAQHQPTIGYSVEEAKHAARVTLAGGLQSFSDDLIRNLIAAGCQVENLPVI